MKVDLPHPESAARPMTMGVTPSGSAWREDVDAARRPAGGAKAEADAATRAPTVNESFMVGEGVGGESWK